MSILFNDLQTSSNYIMQSLENRQLHVIRHERIVVDYNQYGRPVYHYRVWTDSGLFHIKFQRSEHIPLADNQIRKAFAENNRLKYVINNFGNGNSTDIGINENVLYELLEIEEKQKIISYLINAVGESLVYPGNSIVYWSRTKDFFDISLQWGTVIYNSGAYKGTVFLAASGWMKLWSDPISAPPTFTVLGQ